MDTISLAIVAILWGAERCVPTPEPVMVKSNTCEYWDTVIDKHSDSKEESEWAKRVMRCESRCDENAYNPSGASGLMQIIVKWHPSMKNKVWDGEESIKYALKKYREGGKGLWICK